MEYFSISPKNINSICKKVTTNIFFRLKIYNYYKHNPDFFYSDTEYEINEKIIEKMFYKCRYSFILRRLFVSVLDNISGKSITNRLFEKMIASKWNRREIIISLAHKKLDYSKMLILCLTNETFECWYEIIQMNIRENRTLNELKFILEKYIDSPFYYLLDDILFETERIIDIPNDKRTLISEYLK